MLFKHQNYIVFICLVFLFSSYQRVEFKQDAKVGYGRINISYAGYSYDTLLLKTAYLNRVDSIFLDSSGFGSFDLPIDQSIFTFLVDPNNPNPTKLLIDVGFEMTIVKEFDTLKFFGNGSDVNVYLNKLTSYESELNAFFETLIDNGWEDSKSIINSYFFLESMVNDFSKIHVSNSSGEVLNTLVLNESIIYCKFLVFNELMHFTLGEDTMLTDSDLDTLGVTNILKSEIFFTSSSHNMYNLLMVYNNYLLSKVFLEKIVEVNELELLNAKRIADNLELAKSIREYLMYYNIYSSISHHGVSEKTFEVITLFENQFKNSKRTTKLYEQVNEFNTLSKGQQALPINFQNTLGHQMSLEYFKGRFIFIDVWASWCGPCIQKMPEIESVVELFPEIQFIFLNKESEKPWRKYIENLDSNIIKNHFILTSSDFHIKYKLYHIPRYIFIDKSGKIVDAFYNYKDSKELIQFLRENVN